MVWKFLSPFSILLGIIGAIAAVAYLWPVGALGAPIALGAFTLFAGLFELVRRIWPGQPKAGAAPDKPEGS